MALGKKTGGRQLGTVNKTGKNAKETVEWVLNKLGNGQRMLEWVEKDPANERLFWSSIFPKLLPLTHAGDKDNPLVVGGAIPITFVAPKPDK